MTDEQKECMEEIKQQRPYWYLYNRQRITYWPKTIEINWIILDKEDFLWKPNKNLVYQSLVWSVDPNREISYHDAKTMAKKQNKYLPTLDEWSMLLNFKNL